MSSAISRTESHVPVIFFKGTRNSKRPLGFVPISKCMTEALEVLAVNWLSVVPIFHYTHYQLPVTQNNVFVTVSPHLEVLETLLWLQIRLQRLPADNQTPKNGTACIEKSKRLRQRYLLC